MTGLISNRDSFLARISNRLGREKAPNSITRPKWTYNPQDSILKDASPDELLEVLKKQCVNIHTDLLETKFSSLKDVLASIAESYGGSSVVAVKDERFTEYGINELLDREWPNQNVDVHVWDPARGDHNVQKAERANIGIVFSDMTLAESGTVVLQSSMNKGRSVNFLPTHFIAIIPKSSLVPRMTQAARFLREKLEKGEHLPSCINFITGPSNSADIEMNLVVGVHGPVKAAYIVVTDM
ncbi:LutC/YkgG family protein [Mesobacillus harenae]|uniref:LutC/YkgG family protein n=1 Tax=Mesobacillus harenae TaxID=2213203 RepID=UPI0015808255|nr:lactate utilization protein C [Mesobacillus harenae]